MNDKERIAELEAEVHKFLAEITETLQALTKVQMVGLLTPF